MRKSLLVLALALLMAGCSAAPAGETLTPPTLAPGDSPAPEPVDAVLVDQAPWFATFRVVARRRRPGTWCWRQTTAPPARSTP